MTQAHDLAATLQGAAAGATVTLAAGTYRGSLDLDRDLTLVAAPGAQVTLVADAGLPLLRIQRDGLRLQLRGLHLHGGEAETGGVLLQRGFSEVLAEDCIFRGGRARQAPGDALYVDAGTVSLRRCTVRGWGEGDSDAPASPAAVLITGVGGLVAEDCTIVGAGDVVLQAREQAEIRLSGGRVEHLGDGAALGVHGTAHARPDVAILDTELVGSPEIAGDPDSRRRVRRSAS
ncbi:MAG: hypothetical protein H6747_01545 [Deltaproteobacteria bacterium]|nr:hypothetical protein [Deltaproteobacteria bacterium]